MSSRNSGTVPETDAERAVANMAQARFQDYKNRIAPLQARLATTIKNMGAPGSAERTKLQAAQAADAGVNFDRAQKTIASRDEGAGVNRGSSAFKLRQLGMNTDKSASIGIGKSSADQMIDDAYVQGLQTLTQLGRGNQATATQGVGESAAIAGQQARSDAAISASNRAANYEVAGTVAGIGGGMMARRRPGGSPPNTGIPTQQDYNTLGVGLMSPPANS